MKWARNFGCATLLTMATAVTGSAEDVRFYEENGATYRETRHVVRRPVSETQYQRIERPVLREQYRTEMHNSIRTYQTPVTDYQWQTTLRNRWNPFAQPYYEQKLVPVTRWETQVENIQVPVTRREVVADTQTIQVPVTTQRFVEEEVIRRAEVSKRPGSGGDPFAQRTTVASRPVTGGVQLRSDPPRYGTRTDWRPSPVDETRRASTGGNLQR